MRHGHLMFFTRYRKQFTSDDFLRSLEESTAAHGHGLMLHAFPQRNSLANLLEKMIKIDEVPYIREQNPTEHLSDHCRLAAEYGSRASAEFLIDRVQRAREVK